MYEISLKNNKKFSCDDQTTILQAAKNNGVYLEHSCLSARCRSCVVKVLQGKTVNMQDELVLSEAEIRENYTLSCNAKPVSDLVLDIEGLEGITLYEKRIFPSKIDQITKLTNDIIKLTLRFPPSANFKFNSGQYVNLIKGNIKRSYSIANRAVHNSKLSFFIKNYENGEMSKFWFEDAKENDLIRVEGPLGGFFYRESEHKNIVFLATGTGVAPVKAIIEEINCSPEDFSTKTLFVIVGARYEKDLFWEPEIRSNIRLKYVPVLSRPDENWNGAKGYVQDVLLEQNIDLSKTQVYACGSNDMIESARRLLIEKKLPENQFYSDAFVCSN
ncbi:2Fe-2S iron-sulfur cluster-binding protein [Seonamhaeicola marinus]|uniref:2Fe-2S iron-sulfur cluster binding domain-containing protein n=1 Tax=Seonamhaeicola marinus TaxID=1912246 RepID=A0A5D0HSB2_9FLAO|nr:2Fe-2S iron-sulfur cluster-binding protein [Seonamhaeicola marinus]TYA74135.1 2Fe-2S iron-sulfur cluster binding domain-containing protein [Seonamhaeicola marinus]